MIYVRVRCRTIPCGTRVTAHSLNPLFTGMKLIPFAPPRKRQRYPVPHTCIWTYRYHHRICPAISRCLIIITSRDSIIARAAGDGDEDGDDAKAVEQHSSMILQDPAAAAAAAAGKTDDANKTTTININIMGARRRQKWQTAGTRKRHTKFVIRRNHVRWQWLIFLERS